MQKDNNTESSLKAAFAKLLALVRFEKVEGVNDPQATVKRVKNMKRVAILIALLIIILIIIILLLRGCQGIEPPHGSVDIPGNVIDPLPPDITPSADLKFKNIQEEENAPFDVKGMNGGDSKSILYRIVATYNSDFILKYDMTVREDEEFRKLAEILKVKVELVGADGDVLFYEGLMSEMPPLELPLTADGTAETELVFRVTAYLDAPLDEQYYGKRLVADMAWWIDGQDNISIANCEFTTASKGDPSVPSDPDDPDDPDNPDTPITVADLAFAWLNKNDNTPFDMREITDGDRQTRYFAFEVTHSDEITLIMDNTIVVDSRLGEILKVRVEIVGEDGNTLLYEGTLDDLYAEHTLSKNDVGKTTVYYKMTVTAEGLTEKYFGTKLICDLSWWLKGTSERLKVPSNKFVAYVDRPTPPDPPKPPETATSIELTDKDGYDNLPFVAENMLPGDTVSEYYCVSVTHDSPQTVRFAITLDSAQELSRVLRVKIERLIPDGTDSLLYDGLMKDCIAVDVSITASKATVTPIYYRVTVYTKGAEVGNEYAGKGLTADFSWQLQ